MWKNLKVIYVVITERFGISESFQLILCLSSSAENASEAHQIFFKKNRKINLKKFITLLLLSVGRWFWYQWNHEETPCLSILWKAVIISKCQFDLSSFGRTQRCLHSEDTWFTLSPSGCDPYVGLFWIIYHWKGHEFTYNRVSARSEMFRNVAGIAVCFQGLVFFPHFKYLTLHISEWFWYI